MKKIFLILGCALFICSYGQEAVAKTVFPACAGGVTSMLSGTAGVHATITNDPTNPNAVRVNCSNQLNSNWYVKYSPNTRSYSIPLQPNYLGSLVSGQYIGLNPTANYTTESYLAGAICNACPSPWVKPLCSTVTKSDQYYLINNKINAGNQIHIYCNNGQNSWINKVAENNYYVNLQPNGPHYSSEQLAAQAICNKTSCG